MILFSKEHFAILLELNEVISNEKFDEMMQKQESIQKDITELQLQCAKKQKANIASLHDRIYSNYETILSRYPPRVTYLAGSK